jgi:hypothetical protein
MPRTHTAAESTKAQPAAATAAETRPTAKDEAEDWLSFKPLLTAKGGDDADTELVFDEE